MSSYGKQIAATTCVKPGMGKLNAIVVSSTSSGVYALYDNTLGDTSGELKVKNITPAAGTVIYFFGMTFTKGISFVLVSGTIEVTVIYE